MAVFDTVAHRRSAGSHPIAFFFDLLDQFAKKRALHQTQNELLRLTDAELEDVGLSRADVLQGNFVRIR